MYICVFNSIYNFNSIFNNFQSTASPAIPTGVHASEISARLRLSASRTDPPGPSIHGNTSVLSCRSLGGEERKEYLYSLSSNG